MDEKKRISWTEARDLALLVQIIAKGVTAFVTSRANTKEKKTYNQMEAWTNSEDGILTLLAQHPEFAGVQMPAFQSVINHVTAADGLLKKHKHLYTPGMEQAEPAAAGTTGTKDESELTELENAIVEVAALYKEAKELEKNKRDNKASQEATLAREGKHMQDKAVEKRYGNLTEDALQKVCCPSLVHLQPAHSYGLSLPHNFFIPQANKRARKTTATSMSRMTWRQYQEEHTDLADSPEELKKKMPTNHILKYPEDVEHPPFLEVCALPARQKTVIKTCMHTLQLTSHIPLHPAAVGRVPLQRCNQRGGGVWGVSLYLRQQLREQEHCGSRVRLPREHERLPHEPHGAELEEDPHRGDAGEEREQEAGNGGQERGQEAGTRGEERRQEAGARGEEARVGGKAPGG